MPRAPDGQDAVVMAQAPLLTEDIDVEMSSPYDRNDFISWKGRSLETDSSAGAGGDTQECCVCRNDTLAVEATPTRLRILTASYPEVKSFVEQGARDFERHMNGAVEVEIMTVDSMTELHDEIVFDAEKKTGQFDGYVTDPIVLGTVVSLNGFVDVTEYVQANDATVDWLDVMLVYRDFITMYEGRIYMFPLDGDAHSLYYRTDVLEHFNLTVPRTWEEYNDVAKAVHNKEYNGTKLIGSCQGRVVECSGPYWATLVLSSMTQTQGTFQGSLFDTKDMSPLTGEALEETIRLLEEQVKYGAPDEFTQCGGGGSISINVKHMNAGRCVLSYNWGDSFKIHMAEGSVIAGKLAVAPTPGSRKVLDRKTRKLVPCDKDKCRYGKYDPEIGWVNVAPYTAFGGWAGVVSAHAKPRNRDLAVELFAFASSREESIKGAIPVATGPIDLVNGQDPFRKSHLDVDAWVRQGYERESAKHYKDTLLEQLQSLNVVVDIRFPTSEQIMEVLDKETHDYLNRTKYAPEFMTMDAASRAQERKEVAQRITSQWQKIISSYDAREDTNMTILESYQRSRGVFVPDMQYNHITTIRPVGLTLAAIIMCCSIAFAFWVFWNRAVRVVKASQPMFLGTICFGTFVMGSAIFPLSIDDGVATVKGCNIACMASPWLFTVGFTIAFSALFSKIWRVNKIFHHRSFRRIKVTEADVLVPFAVLLVMNVALLLAWTLMDPLYWYRPDGLNTIGRCVADGKASKAFLALIVTVIFCALVLANVQAYQARGIGTEFSESKYVALSMASILQTLIIGLPLLFLVDDNPSANFFVRSALIFVVCMSMLLLIFIPKMKHLRKYKRDRNSKRNSMPDSSVFADHRGSHSRYSHSSHRGSNRSSHRSSHRASYMGSEMSRGINRQDSDMGSGLRVVCHPMSEMEEARKANAELDGFKGKVRSLAELLEQQGIDSGDLFEEVGLRVKKKEKNGMSGVDKSNGEQAKPPEESESPQEESSTKRVSFAKNGVQ